MATLRLGYAQWLAGKNKAAAEIFKSVQSKDGSADVAPLFALPS